MGRKDVFFPMKLQ